MKRAVFPLVRFGVLTDTQYADCDSKPAWWNPQLTRYYRTALQQIDKAFDHWTKDGSVTFALQLGDIIDGVNRRLSDPDLALRTVLDRFERHRDIPTFHTVGNHELYNFNRIDLTMYFYEYLVKMHLPHRMFAFPGNDGDSCQSAEKQVLIKMEDPKIRESNRRKSFYLGNGSSRKTPIEDEQFPARIGKTEAVVLAEKELDTQDEKTASISLRNDSLRLHEQPVFNESFLLNDQHHLSSTTYNRESVFLKSECVYNTPSLYYTFRPVPGVKFVSLDCFEVSVIGYEKTDSRYREAADILFEHHGHQDFDGWDCADLLEGPNKRFQQMNGAVSQQQIAWLDHELEESDRLGEKVVVFGHVCVHPESADWDCLLWNYSQVLDIFHAHRCVMLYLCGHTHQNGYALDDRGIHYVVLAGVIETAPEESAFATVSIYQNRVEIEGQGRETSRTLWLNGTATTGLEKEGGTDAVKLQPVSALQTPSVKVVV